MKKQHSLAGGVVPGPAAGTLAALAAYLVSNPGATAQAEARKVLALIADTSEDVAVQQAARQALNQAQSEDDL